MNTCIINCHQYNRIQSLPACKQHKEISETVSCTWIWVWRLPGDQSSSHDTEDQEHGTGEKNTIIVTVTDDDDDDDDDDDYKVH